MFALNKGIPFLPIDILCRGFYRFQVPAEKKFASEHLVTPQVRWRMLKFVELILINSVPGDYREANRNELAEVAYILEKTLYCTADTATDYNDIQSLPRRMCLIGWNYSRNLVEAHTRADVDAACEQYLKASGHEHNCLVSHGAGAA